ncbi:DUF4369 domain-containing protein [Hymenobacter fodinae]|uniref:DUF4369 domain-containing protein n=1 Tax=Hymenobacter fodinae TaxID=2510796 RepID=A0A4Z0P3U0_9BACT|nr:DUF4369 domain-containing protein [Hymenobacter fodinae]TGE04839.1 DUF4369 domain-containing protein [Hymenobacter fodinae]
MKLPLLLLALLSGSTSLTQAQTKTVCQVEGNIKGLGNQAVVVFYDWKGQQRRDTVHAHNDQFSYTARPSDDGQFNLKIIPSRFTPVWFEAGQVTVAGNIAEPSELTVTGTPENTLSTQYNQQIEWKFEHRAKGNPDSIATLGKLLGQATRAFITAHPKARTSADLLYQQAKFHHDRPVGEYEKLFRNLSPRCAGQCTRPSRGASPGGVAQAAAGRPPAPTFQHARYRRCGCFAGSFSGAVRVA